MERLFDSYLRTKTSDEEVYEEERQLDIANRGQGVVRWREEKACTGPGLVHLGDPNQVRMGRQSAQLTDANFGSNSAPYTGPVFSLCSSSVYIIILRSFTQMLCIHFLINTVRA